MQFTPQHVDRIDPTKAIAAGAHEHFDAKTTRTGEALKRMPEMDWTAFWSDPFSFARLKRGSSGWPYLPD